METLRCPATKPRALSRKGAGPGEGHEHDRQPPQQTPAAREASHGLLGGVPIAGTSGCPLWGLWLPRWGLRLPRWGLWCPRGDFTEAQPARHYPAVRISTLRGFSMPLHDPACTQTRMSHSTQTQHVQGEQGEGGEAIFRHHNQQTPPSTFTPPALRSIAGLPRCPRDGDFRDAPKVGTLRCPKDGDFRDAPKTGTLEKS